MLNAILGFVGWFVVFVITIIILIIRILKGIGKRNFRAVLIMLAIAVSSIFFGHSILVLVISWFAPVLLQWVFPKFFKNPNGGLFNRNKMKPVDAVVPSNQPSTNVTTLPITVVPQITNITRSEGASAPAYKSDLGTVEKIDKISIPQNKVSKATASEYSSLEQELKVLDAKIKNGEFTDENDLDRIVKRRRYILDKLGM